MKKILNLTIHDFQLIYRDKVLMIILLIPLIMGFLLWWGVPPFMYKFAIDLQFYPLIVGVFCIVTAISPAYLVSFIMLDEKDEDVLTVIRTMPLSPIYFLCYRIIFTIIFGFFTSLVILAISNLHLSFTYMVFISILIALIAPISALTIVTFSRNKIEGLTFLKGINFLTILPILSFFTGTTGKIAMAIIPTFWIYQALMNSYTIDYFFLFLGSGLVINLLLLILLTRQFIKKIFYR